MIPRTALTWLGMQHLQLLDVAAGSGFTDGTCIIYHGADGLLVKQHTISYEQDTSPVREGQASPIF